MVFKWLRDPRFKPPEDDLPPFLPVEVLPDASLAAAMSDTRESMPLCARGCASIIRRGPSSSFAPDRSHDPGWSQTAGLCQQPSFGEQAACRNGGSARVGKVID